MNGYDLSRDWFNFCFENPEKINPNHSALYFFCIEHCNRLGWKEKFGLPMEMAKDAIGIKNFRTYSKTFNDLINWGFIKLIQKSKNQYSSNIIALVKNTKAHTKALDKAMIKHSQKQVTELYNDSVYINKQETIEQETRNNDFEKFWNEYDKKVGKKDKIKSKWDKLSEEKRKLIFDYIPKYKLSQPDKQFRKNPETFLNNESWNDELIITNNKTKNISTKEEFLKDVPI